MPPLSTPPSHGATIAGNTAWFGIEIAVSALVGFGTSVAIARVVGPEAAEVGGDPVGVGRALLRRVDPGGEPDHGPEPRANAGADEPHHADEQDAPEDDPEQHRLQLALAHGQPARGPAAEEHGDEQRQQGVEGRRRAQRDLRAAHGDLDPHGDAQQDQTGATDELLPTNGIVGDDRIIALTEDLEFGGALHQFPLRRRRLALSSSTGPRIAGSGAPKSGFLRLKMQIH